MRSVIFDLDGTLADTAADLIAAANTALAARGHARMLMPGADDRTAFRGGKAMLRLGLARLGLSEPEAAREIEAAFPILIEAYGAAIAVHTQLYPGAISALQRLRAAGCALGVCTNKPAHLAESLLTELRIRRYFSSMIGADTLPVRKPDPAPYRAAVAGAGGDLARSVLIGDTETDRETARAAGVPCILVGFGPDGRDVARLAPEAVIDHFDALDAEIDRLLSPRENGD